MPTYRCKLFEVIDTPVGVDLSKPRELQPFTVNALNCDFAIKEARKYVRSRGNVIRAANLTHNRQEIVVYVYKTRPKSHLAPRSVRESELGKEAD